MRNRTSRSIPSFSAAICALSSIFAITAVQALPIADLNGQWVGNSQIVGQKNVAKTSLSLGALDGDDSILRVEGSNNCTLKRGTYSAQSNAADTWTLSFKEVKGGDACERLGKGTFSLHRGSSMRVLEFEVSYPGEDGQQRVSRGALSRYP
jgi:hypothetical protein